MSSAGAHFQHRLDHRTESCRFASVGLVFAGGLGLVIHALGGAYLAGAGVVLGVLSAMLAIWTLFVGLGIEQRNAER